MPVTAERSLSTLRNVGKATLADFALLGVTTIGALARHNADELFTRLCKITEQRHDPCVHDVFSATIHEARSGEALDWWVFSAARKERQRAGAFPVAPTSSKSRTANRPRPRLRTTNR